MNQVEFREAIARLAERINFDEKMDIVQLKNEKLK